jgi:hypothetical protein
MRFTLLQLTDETVGVLLYCACPDANGSLGLTKFASNRSPGAFGHMQTATGHFQGQGVVRSTSATLLTSTDEVSKRRRGNTRFTRAGIRFSPSN